jgi:CHAT domain-containing protein/Tfp pilus assembly protein PilF
VNVMRSRQVRKTGRLFSRATAAYVSGDIRQALQLLDEAAALVPGDDAAQLSLLLLQKAGWLREGGYVEDAASTLRNAVREVERLPVSGHEAVWSLLRMEQGRVAKRQGDFKAAEAFLAEAETLAEESPEQERDLNLPDVYANQASLYLSQGRLSDAQHALLAALEIDQRVGNKRNESNDLNMLGQVSGELGETDTARAYFTKAIQVASQNGLTREEWQARSNMAAQMNLAGDHQAAAELFSTLGNMEAEGGDESGLACSVANQGVAAARAGDLEQAVTLLTRSHELHMAAGNWLHSVQDMINLSGTEEQLGHFDRALSHAQEALESARKFGLVEMLWQAESSVADRRMKLAAQQPGGQTAKTETYEVALAEYRRAIDVVELLRSNIDRPEERQSLLAGKEHIYDRAITLCLTLGRKRDAFELCEQARMRSFLEALGSSRVEQLESNDPGAERRGQLVSRLRSPLTPPGEKPGLMDELRTLRAETTARKPALAVITEAELPTEDEIRASIPPGACLLEYFLLGDAVIIFLLDRDGLKDCYVGRFDEPAGKLIRHFRGEIEADDTDLASGSKLAAALLEPVWPELADTANLIVVPHSSLHYVPFSALWYVPAGDDAPPRQYLKDSCYLTTVPSASYLAYLARTAPQRQYGASVVLGNPTGDLPGADTEARNVAGTLGVTARLGAEATRHALLDAQDPAVLHVASHGTYDSTDPLLSGLRMADGVVTVEDLLTSGPAPGLLVLSGCVTGMSDRKPGDELIGLAQAALRRGTRSVVATLWETRDESSTVFFEHFYDALTRGVTISLALAYGRKALATGPGGFDHPVHWAPFVVIGDPDHRVADPDQGPAAVFNRGVEIGLQGDIEGAKTIFDQLASSADQEVASQAALNLGTLLFEEDIKGALEAFQRAAGSGDSDVAPTAYHRIGQILELEHDIDGALAAYQRAADSGHPDAAPGAALDIGALLAQQGDIKGAKAAYQRAIDSNHAEAAPKAAINLGGLLAEQDDIDGAQAAYQRAIDSGDEEIAPMAAVRLGTLLAQHGDPAGARPALQKAIDSGHSYAMPWAAYNLGILLAQQQDLQGALTALQTAVESNNPEAARDAATLIAQLKRAGTLRKAVPAQLRNAFHRRRK